MAALPSTPPPPTRRRCLLVVVALTVLVLRNFFFLAATNTPRKETASIIACADVDDAASIGFHHLVAAANKEQQQPTTLPRNNKKRLEFVHIPKTGGSSIESATSRLGLSWGLWCVSSSLSFCHCSLSSTSSLQWFYLHPFYLFIYIFYSKFVGSELSFNNSNGAVRCPDTFTTGINYWSYGIVPSKNCISWHLPSYFFDNVSPQYNPYHNATLFAIVRDPYERMLSEYYYRTKRVLHWDDAQIDSVDTLNAWLTARMESRLPFLNHPYPWTEPPYCFAQGHFIPQRKFVYQEKDHRRVVDHVLRFENLRAEFDQLMARYGLSHIVLPAVHTFQSNKTMGIHDFTNQTRQLIERVYEEDFATFHYPYLADR